MSNELDTGAGLATMGNCPAWDASLARYLAARTLVDAEEAWGDYSAAIDVLHVESDQLRGEHGPDWRKKPELAGVAMRATQRSEQVHERYVRVCCEPLWRAAQDLVLVPAPSLGAALFKAWVIRKEEVWNDLDFEGDCMDILKSDLARFVPGSTSA